MEILLPLLAFISAGALILLGSLLAPLPFIAIGLVRTEFFTPRGPGRAAWRMARDSSYPHFESSSAVLGGKLYVAGGFGSGPSVSRNFERYSPESDSWEKLPPLPAARHHPAAAACNGKIFVFGGHGDLKSHSTFSDTFAFDPRKNRWETKSPMPTARAAAGAVEFNGKIYVIGGRSGGYILEGYPLSTALRTVEAYDPETDSWETLPPMKVARDHVGVAEMDGRIYAIGGRSWTLMNEVGAAELFDPASGRWETLPSLPLPISGDVFALDGKIFMAGGSLTLFTSPYLLAFDGKHGWQNFGRVPSPGHGCATGVINGTAFIVGGGSGFGISFSRRTRVLRLKGR